MFGPLYVKSSYTFLGSNIKITDLIKRAKELQFDCVAVADTDSMYGAMEFYKEAKRNGIVPIFACEFKVENNDSISQMILIAKNTNGYKELVKLSSLAMSKQNRHLQSSDISFENLIGITVYSGTNAKVVNGSTHLGIGAYDNLSEAISFAKANNLIPVVANRTTHIHKEDAKVIALLKAIKEARVAKQEESPEFEWMLSKEEIKNLFPADIIENTEKLILSIDSNIEFKKDILPKYPTPNGVTASTFLRELCKVGLKKRLENNVNETYTKRLVHEINIIEQMGFEDYFLITWDFIKYAKQNDIAVGPGRGSAAGSLVAYVLGITNIDPLKYDLLFERFLNPERISMPDIDIDFQDTRRDEVINYVHGKYDHDHVASIATFQTMGAKQAIRDAGRALGVSLATVNLISKAIPQEYEINLTDALEKSLRLKELISNNELNQELYDMARKIEGIPRQAGTHAAGIVISNAKLSDVIPTANSSTGMSSTQFEMGYLEELGLLKFDFLGLINLTTIKTIVELIKERTGKEININQIPLDDAKTFEVIANADTLGIFQLEKDGMRNTLRQMKCDKFEDIVATIALYRPGPMENIPAYIDRKHGRKIVQYVHDSLEDILKDTYGIIVYQEQIMQIAQKVAGFTFAKADNLRRAMGKKDHSIMVSLEKEFVDGAMTNGYTQQKAKEIYELVYKFANYGFNKSHSVAYAMIGYQLAYLKANYKLEFTAALLSSTLGNELKTQAIINEMKKYGIKVLKPSINKSCADFTIADDVIMYSLTSIANVGPAAYNKIKEERDKGPFKDFIDFILRIEGKGISIESVQNLIWAGAFDEFGKNRQTLIAAIGDVKKYASLIVSKDGQIMMDLDVVPRPNIVTVVQDDVLVAKMEKDVIGFNLSSHPISQIKEKYTSEKLKFTDVSDIIANGQRVYACVTIDFVKEITTKSGELMAFVDASDDTGKISITMFPKDYAKWHNQIAKNKVMFVDGELEIGSRTSFVARNIKVLEEVK